MTVVDVELPTSTLGTAVSPRYRQLEGVKLGTVRSTFSPSVYERSHTKALAYLVFDLALYALFIIGVFIAPNIGFKVVCGLLAGCFWKGVGPGSGAARGRCRTQTDDCVLLHA